MKKTKKPQLSTKKLPEPKIAVFDDEYFDYFQFKKKPVNQAAIEGIAQAFFDDAKNTNLLYGLPWFTERGIDPWTVDRWRKRYDWFDKAVIVGLDLVGKRREMGVVSKFEPGFIERSMPMYSAAWEKNEQRRSNLKVEQGKAGAGNITVKMEDYGSTGQETSAEKKERLEKRRDRIDNATI